MQYEEAKELIIYEGTSLGGIYMCVRERQDPGRERMMRIKQAVEVLGECEHLTAPIDRRIAYALCVIALETEVQSAMAQDEKPWRDGEFRSDLHELQMAIYGYLEGDLVFEES